MKTYTAIARRSGEGWDVEVPDVADVRCSVERLDQVATAVTDAIAVALDVEPDTFEVEVNSTVDEDVDAQVVDVAAAERHPDTAARTVTTAQQRLAHRLVGMGLSHHDSAYLMNLSHHRVRHLVESPRAEPEAPEEHEPST